MLKFLPFFSQKFTWTLDLSNLSNMFLFFTTLRYYNTDPGFGCTCFYERVSSSLAELEYKILIFKKNSDIFQCFQKYQCNNYKLKCYLDRALKIFLKEKYKLNSYLFREQTSSFLSIPFSSLLHITFWLMICGSIWYHWKIHRSFSIIITDII